MEKENNYYNQIKELLIDNEIYQKVKDYSKERNKVITYYEIGKLLCDAGKHYGENIIDKYSEKLMVEVGKKYNKRTLFRMKQFYMLFSNQKVSTLSTLLSWSHYVELLSLKDEKEINYYLNLSVNQSLGIRQLRERIKSKEYDRLDNKTKLKLIEERGTSVTDYIKNPIIVKNSLNCENISEKVLQRLILEDIPSFLDELGSGFCFIKNEYPIKLGYIYNYIDLLLYNYLFKCFVVVELKVTELKKEHIGQIKLYMNYINKHIKDISDNETIGIIICKKDNKYVIEYCSDSRIIAREYLLV